MNDDKNQSPQKDTGKELAKTGISKLAGKAATTLAVASEVGVVAAKQIGKAVEKITKKILNTLDRYKNEIGKISAGIFLLGAGLGSTSLAVAGGIGSLYGFEGVKSAGRGIIDTASATGGAFLSMSAPSIGIPLVVAVLSIPIGIAIISFIINTSAFVVPFSEGLLTSTGQAGDQPSGILDSPYMNVTKTADPQGDFPNSDLVSDPDDDGEQGRRITYHIGIESVSGSLTNFRFSYDCQVYKEGAEPACPSTDPDPLPTPPDTIEEGSPFSFSYTQNYRGFDYEDSLITDTFTVTADADAQSNTTERVSEYVTFGDPPVSCPNGWPLDGNIEITQGPGFPHRGPNSVDLRAQSPLPIYSTHEGVIEIPPYMGPSGGLSGYGNYVKIISFCDGNNFASLYAHMSIITIDENTTVEPRTPLGLTGSSGGVAAHLHYEFQVPPSLYVRTDYTCPTPNTNFAPYMAPPYIPDSPVASC